MQQVQIKSARIVGGEEKTQQEIQKEMLQEHEQTEAKKAEEAAKAAESAVQDNGIKDEDVLSYINTKHGRSFNSFDELLAEKVVEKEPEQDEAVAKYVQFKNETGRGFDDFIKYQRDVASLSDNDKLIEYYLDTNPGFTREDAAAQISIEFGYDESIDDEKDITKKKLSFKKELGRAIEHLNGKREKYKAPLESSGTDFTKSQEYIAYQNALKKAREDQAAAQERSRVYAQRTEELFSESFNGFDFEVAKDRKLTFKPASAQELKKSQSNLMDFVGKFTDSKGMITDIQGYHRALAIGSNAEKFAKFFYEQGMADATDKNIRNIKNIPVNGRQTPQSQPGGPVARLLNKGDGNRLKVNI